MYVRPRCLELAAATIAERMSRLSPDERVRLVAELGLVIEQTVACWVEAERHNHDLTTMPDDNARARRRDAAGEVPRRYR
jgi:hypothetical protein